jgi:hypothetical protein
MKAEGAPAASASTTCRSTASGHGRRILAEYAQHYKDHRPHQARGQGPPLHEPSKAIDVTARIKGRQAVQGLISEYREQPSTAAAIWVVTCGRACGRWLDMGQPPRDHAVCEDN